MMTGFTVAHSLTLALSTLDLVSLSIPVMETAIALSIVFLTTEIARGNRQTLAHRFPLLVTGLFGLLHGFGFASVLREVGLPPTELPTALLFFNVGVEIGQIVFVVVIYAAGLGLQAPMRRSRFGPRGFMLEGSPAATATAYAVGAIASFWTIERWLAICYPPLRTARMRACGSADVFSPDDKQTHQRRNRHHEVLNFCVQARCGEFGHEGRAGPQNGR